jgi:aspartokinase/homoserine dehydrogenase 1
MRVLKFGGSSVGKAATVRTICTIVRNSMQQDRTIVVVSALGGITDALLHCGLAASIGDDRYKNDLQTITGRHLDMARELLPVQQQSGVLSYIMKQFHAVEDICNGIFLVNEFSDRTRDKILSYGELISSTLLSAFFQSEGMDNKWVDARELITTNDHFTNASVLFKETEQRVKEKFNGKDQLFVVPGFIASDASGHTTTLGRGGSDYTASIIGASLDAEVVEIWTDVSGMMTADPRQVSHARPIPQITYQEAMELSHFGARVIYPPTIQPLLNKGIPVWIRNTFAPGDPGTCIQSKADQNGDMIRGITCVQHMALASLEGSGMVGIPGFSKRLFEALANNCINIILITQASSEHSITVGIEEQTAQRAKEVIDAVFSHEIEKGTLQPLTIEKDLSIIALVGDKMKNHPGISGRMFSALGRNGVNVRAIAQGSSERNISAVIAMSDVKKALNVLHEDFFETVYKQVNLFIAGTGNVGGKLLAQIAQQQNYLQRQLNLQVRIIGLANSRTMLFSDEGVDPVKWKEALNNGTRMNMDDFISTMVSKNLRNSIFVDMTASESVAMVYENLFPKSISVVACNKIACSASYSHYRNLKDLSRDFNSSFLFETNVGASLPIIGSLNDLLRSGDAVQKIEAVLSGTLNYVFNHYDGTVDFAEVVRQAQKEGYTEPDPRLDLSGTDVMRKIMILARESGEQLEMSDIHNESFMPPSCMMGSVDDFYDAMKKEEAHFKQLYLSAAEKGKKLKFVASYEHGKASVGLQHVEQGHDFFHLYGKDNIVLFYTNRYVSQPMVIKGAGAGAEVTASGVFADIIRSVRV